MIRPILVVFIGLIVSAGKCVEPIGNTNEHPFIFDKTVILHPDSLVVGGSFLESGLPYDKELIEAAYGLLSDNAVFFDIGASTGSFSLLAKFRNIKVHAFEPNPTIVPILEANISLNGIQEWVQVHTQALSDKDEKNTLKCPVDDNGKLIGTGLGTLGANPLRFSKYKEIPIDCVTLDNFAHSHKISRLDFIKIDTEGYELNILRGGKKTIKKFRPTIIMEFVEKNMKQAGHTPAQLLSFVEDELQYACVQIGTEDLLCKPA